MPTYNCWPLSHHTARTSPPGSDSETLNTQTVLCFDVARLSPCLSPPMSTVVVMSAAASGGRTEMVEKMLSTLAAGGEFNA